MRALVAVVVLTATTAAAAQQPTLEPVATVKQIMTVMIVPASSAVVAAASQAPKSETDWGRVGNHALMLAESGNLLMVGARAKDRDEWMRMSRNLRDAAQTAMKAVDARNPDALLQARGRIYQACDQCHARYQRKTALKVKVPSK